MLKWGCIGCLLRGEHVPGVGIYSWVGIYSKYCCTVDIILQFSAWLLSKDLDVSVPSVMCSGKFYILLAESNCRGEFSSYVNNNYRKIV